MASRSLPRVLQRLACLAGAFACISGTARTFVTMSMRPLGSSSRLRVQRAATSENTADSTIYCLNVNLYVKPERREEFLACICANQHGTLTSEPLALQYDWGESESEPNTFHFHEQYLGKAGFEAHTQAPHFAAWEEFAATDPFTREPEVQFFERRARPE
mmetsp:Transcript_73752/g.216440  ORF Transcript_73752/g.216440 Transcript_73752/m.216440 type:complete len:160 (-) Transcript_73752:44-523(-)